MRDFISVTSTVLGAKNRKVNISAYKAIVSERRSPTTETQLPMFMGAKIGFKPFHINGLL